MVGTGVGTGVGVTVGAAVGAGVGIGEGVTVGAAVGAGVRVGATVGVTDGATVGAGVRVGATVGAGVGVIVGPTVGVAIGVTVAAGVGVKVCVTAGVSVGAAPVLPALTIEEQPAVQSTSRLVIMIRVFLIILSLIPVFFICSAYLRTGGHNVFGYHKSKLSFRILCAEKHSFGLKAGYFTGCKVCKNHYTLSDHFLCGI